MKIILNLILFSLLFVTHVFGNELINITSCSSSQTINRHIYIYEAKDSNTPFSEISKSKSFIKSDKSIINLGVSNSTYWIHFTITNKTSCRNLQILVNQPLLSSVEFHYFNNSTNKWVNKKIDNSSFSKKGTDQIAFPFELEIPENQIVDCYLGLKGHSQLLIPLKIGNPFELTKEITKEETLYGFYGGFLLAMVLYNLFLYFTVKDISYLYYLVYILLMCLNQLTLCGFSAKYIWPNSTFWANQSVNITSCITSICAISFLQVFLQVKKNLPLHNTILNLWALAFLITISVSMMGNTHLGFQMMQGITLIASIYMLFVGYRILKLGYRPARFYMYAWSILLIGVIIFVLKDYEIFPYNNFTSHTVQYASAIEVVVLSLALADRINILEKEKQESRAQAILVLEENERIIKEQNILLEKKVKERTHELELANDEISRTLKNLKEAQAQLVHAEKMASLGQLTAGIAHEINNPINFVTSSINPLKRDLDFIQQIISSAETFLNEDDKQKRLQNMETLLDDMDYSYLIEEINMLLHGIQEGSTRTSEIVKSLRNFSRLDETDFKKANIIEGIESTLLLLNSSLSDAKIKVTKHFTANPNITCQPGKLNQVYMNILNNAVYAIKTRKDAISPGAIDISVSDEGETISIKIQDNGIGMSQKTKERLFEPFYTTKDVGEGTGLGLSIVYTIIESHQGKITVDSEEGVGTLFTISLPAK